MLYYVYIISYTFFFSRTSQGVSRFHCYILCKIVFWRYLSPSSSHLFFFSLYAHVHMCIYFFFSFFFSDKCHLWFVYKVYVCIIHSYVFTCICTSFMFYTYTYIYMRVSACMCMCMRVCVCVLIRVCARAWYIYLSRIISVASLQITRTLYKGFFFSFARLLLLEFASSDCIHLLSLKYMQRGCHGTPRAVHRIRGNTSRKFSFF